MWFLTGETTEILNTPATPGARLKNDLIHKIGQTIGPEGGFTKVVEDGGIPTSMGLKKRDHHSFEKCIYNKDYVVEKRKDCEQMNTCYMITCNTCSEEASNIVKKESKVISNKQNYIGTSGRSMLARSRNLLDAIEKLDPKNAMAKQIIEIMPTMWKSLLLL